MATNTKSPARAGKTETAGPRQARRLLSLSQCADELECSYRFLQLEINRGHLIAHRISPRLVRVHGADWEQYLNRGCSKQP